MNLQEEAMELYEKVKVLNADTLMENQALISQIEQFLEKSKTTEMDELTKLIAYFLEVALARGRSYQKLVELEQLDVIKEYLRVYRDVDTYYNYMGEWMQHINRCKNSMRK